MADSKREIERKFEFAPGKAGKPAKDDRPRKGAKPGKRAKSGADPARVPDLTGTAGIARTRGRGTVLLDAVYYDTPDRRLAAGGVTLRRRTGGEDAGWHLKLPVSPGVRDEVHAPLAASEDPDRDSDSVPGALAALVRSRIRRQPLEPQVRLVSSRDLTHLLDADGHLLAELSTDAVLAERGAATAEWTEVEVELADGTDPALLDAVEKTFHAAGLKVSDAPSKLARALADTGAAPPAPPGTGPADGSAGAHVLAYLREQRDILVAQDPAVRRDLPDSVHQMRVATRRLRSAFKSHRKVLDREVTDPIAEQLRRLAAELGVDRDQEVLARRLRERLDEVPAELRLGPVADRLRTWDTARRQASRGKALAALDSAWYLALLDSLDAVLADPPLLKAAARPAESVLPKGLLHDDERLAERVEQALAMEPGADRDVALHGARKAAKRARYAADAARSALGKPAKRMSKAAKSVQTLLGDHQDSVVSREALRGIAEEAVGASEASFTWGLLYAREEAFAERLERELPDVWDRARDPELRSALT
ncbi:CYTH and CHAD domain-containing protein [Streptomyces sp. NPDC048383]|uniref:CYTH and CHAD domain-containing protein n=1 Tax=Streptomyces sp. NPDC048383 TaxID=3155386 RepID=UPI003432AEA2